MSVETWARTAYRHAKVTLVIGCSNNPERVKATGGWSNVAVRLSRSQRNEWVRKDTHWVLCASKKEWAPEVENDHDFEMAVAKRAASNRAGNCGENAAVVYAFLYERARGKDIGLVSRVSVKDPGDHEFVVINRGHDAESLVVDPWWGVICTVPDVTYKTGNCLYCEDGADVKGMQKYIMAHGTEVVCEFDTGGG